MAWDESKLQVLVLTSLGVQCVLALFAQNRKFRIPSWYRLLIWLSYLGSDALALYALATLFNRRSGDLEVFWAPLLLMHLGGQIFITAYNIEDNELWRRHFVTAISQVTLALYVFCKSWPSKADRRLLVAAILLFIPGIFKCFAKPLACKSASFESQTYIASFVGPRPRRMEKYLEKYVQEAKSHILSKDSPSAGRSHADLFNARQLFIDSRYPYSTRVTILKSYLELGPAKHHVFMKASLGYMFDILYTKKKSIPSELEIESDDMTWATWFGGLVDSLSVIVPIVAIALVHSSHKKEYRVSDVVITFVLLYGMYFLEIFSRHVMEKFEKHWKWPDTVAQQSIIGYLARNKRYNNLTRLASCLQCKDFLDQYWSMEPCVSRVAIGTTYLVRQHVQDGWEVYITDAKSYREFGDFRGQWTLERETCEQHLIWSLEKPFDESIILWHLATDFCFHVTGASPADKCAQRCREISNYMMHLLFANPELLMSGIRKNLFKIVYTEVEGILDGMKVPREEGELTAALIDKLKLASEIGFVQDAWMLAQRLMDLDGEKMWKVIRGVWLEMLCFSASRSRGFLHAKSLGTGGEFLSYIWLLLSHAGMETYPERLHRTRQIHKGEDDSDSFEGEELSVEEENAAGSLASQDEDPRSEEETPATSHPTREEGTVTEIEIIVTQ